MGELLEAIGHVAVDAVLLGALAWALYYAFGPQALGLPAMLGAFVVVAGVVVVGNVGLIGVLIVVLALAALVVVIGMAMTGGEKRSRPKRDSRD